MRVVVLTGAGISAESGIRTFRGADGLWEGERIENVATPEAFLRDPQRVYRFYNERRQALRAPEVAPNPAHLALARLEAELKDRFLLVTQNIDDLHQRAGSQRVLPMHGELLAARCDACGAVSRWYDDFDARHVCPACQQTGVLRPHVVWFGEMPLYMDDIQAALQSADIFSAIGTSGNVYPAAGFAAVARRAGAQTCEINLAPSNVASDFDMTRYGLASCEVVNWVDGLLAQL
jgi:NAD-dependent deacetylase